MWYNKWGQVTRVIGDDIDPVAACITRFELEDTGYDPAVPEIAYPMEK